MWRIKLFISNWILKRRGVTPLAMKLRIQALLSKLEKDFPLLKDYSKKNTVDKLSKLKYEDK